MYRKILLATVASLGLLAMTSEAKAHGFVAGGYYGPRPYPRPIYRPVPVVQPVPVYRPIPLVRPVPVYNVYYRSCATAPWTIYQGFPVYQDAYRATFGLRARGFEVFVR